ncbi:MAG TPA: CRTAC1 family protein, partial [Planctomycetes bacterium]|nr:CRTAC1 family protein [Planctomycetota bacterium]
MTEPGEDLQDLEESDDSVIGDAFILSLKVIGIIAFIVVLIFLLPREEKETEDVGEGSPVVARGQQKDRNPPEISFTDITTEAGITEIHRNGASGEKLLPETMGSGCAFADIDGDGDPDLILASGRQWPWDEQGDPDPSIHLYINDGSGHFTDRSREWGLTHSPYATGLAVADFDGDGDRDLFVAAVGADLLLRNEGGHFTDVTAEAGVAGEDDAWSTSAGFFDADGDGDLDLFVCQYVEWTREIDIAVDYRLTGVGRAYGPPTNFKGSHSRLHINAGDGHFTDTSTSAGIQVTERHGDRPAAKALAFLPCDLDGDGELDIVVANDTVGNFLLRNLGNGSFEEIGATAGLAFDSNGAATGAMGIDSARFRNDGSLGIAIGNFASEMTSLFVTEPGGLQFFDESVNEGVGPASRRRLSFGLFFFDVDLDGNLDLLQANGHLEEEIAQVQPGQSYRQPAQLFWNSGPGPHGCFVEVPASLTGDLAIPIVGRGASYADIDGDGDLDVLLTQTGGAPLLLRNDQESGNHWLRILLVDRPPNLDAIGATVTLRSGGVVRSLQVMPTRSYLSQVEFPLTFGLADNSTPPVVEVKWPDG